MRATGEEIHRMRVIHENERKFFVRFRFYASVLTHTNSDAILKTLKLVHYSFRTCEPSNSFFFREKIIKLKGPDPVLLRPSLPGFQKKKWVEIGRFTENLNVLPQKKKKHKSNI